VRFHFFPQQQKKKALVLVLRAFSALLAKYMLARIEENIFNGTSVFSLACTHFVHICASKINNRGSKLLQRHFSGPRQQRRLFVPKGNSKIWRTKKRKQKTGQGKMFEILE
jgi:hypothetical protein